MKRLATALLRRIGIGVDGIGARRSRGRRAEAPEVQGLECRMVLSGSAARGIQAELRTAIRALAASGVAAPDGGPSNVLIQDARHVAVAYAAYQRAVLGGSGATAAADLNSAIAANLANLPRNGPSLTASLRSGVASLSAKVGSAGTASAKVAAIDASFRDAATAILSDGKSSQVPSSALKAYDASAKRAFKDFEDSIQAARRQSTSSGAPLSPPAVSRALLTLQSSLISSLGTLGPGFLASRNNPGAAIAQAVSKGDRALTAIPGPKVATIETPAQFSADVKAAVANIEAQTGEAVVGGVQAYNLGLQ